MPKVVSQGPGLAANSVYYYRYYASNSVGGAWAVPSVSFRTPGPPVVDNDAGALVTVGKATLRGALTGGIQAGVTLYWGERDGGTDPDEWARLLALGIRSEGAFSSQPSGRTGSPAGLSTTSKCSSS